MGIDDKLRSKNGNTVRYFLTDHLGSTVALADASGAIVSSTSYDSFGNAASSIPTSYQYTGREYDADTGLYYYRNRWYDPETGRFISEDPIGFAGGDINLYGYVGNNPHGYIDPFGLAPCSSNDPCNLSGDEKDKRIKQCKAIRELLRREKAEGTGPAAYISTVTEYFPAFNRKTKKTPDQGSTMLEGLNNRNYGNLIINGKEFDIDWFVDANRFTGPFSRVLGPAVYVVGKSLWSSTNYVLGRPQTYYLPWEDPGELEAVLALTRGKKFSDLFDDKWFKEYCSCE